MDGAPSSSLFDSTSRLAGEAAARASGSRRRRILAILAKGPAAIFEIAAEMGLFDHQISGRFGELERDGLIRKTGERRKKPETGCEAEVYAVCGSSVVGGRLPSDGPAAPGVAEAMGYPGTLLIEEEAFERGIVLDNDGLPGIPYDRRVDGLIAGGARIRYRVGLVECEGCGRPLKAVEERIADPADRSRPQTRRTFRCGTEGCRRVWHLMMVREPGGTAMLAMVMKTM